MKNYNKFLNFISNLNNYSLALNDNSDFYDKVISAYVKNNIKPSSPLLLGIQITDKCNGKCKFCIANSKCTQYEDDKASSLILNRLNELKKFNSPLIFILSGGEPLLFPKRCIEYLNVFKSENTIFHILTNMSIRMSKMHEELIELLENNPFSLIQTSLDSMDEDEHQMLRSGTDLKLILKNINEIKKKNIKLKINTTISEQNHKNVMEIVKYAYNEGIDSMHINHVLPGGRAKGILNNIGCHEIIESMIYIFESKEFNGIKEHTMTFPNEILPFSFIGSKWEDILMVYNKEKSNKYLSTNFVSYISHDSNLISSGWTNKKEYNLRDIEIIDFFKLQNSNETQNYNIICKSCLLYMNCNNESFYTGKCELIDLNKKIREILEYKSNLSDAEQKRINLLSFLKKSGCGITKVAISMTNKCNGNCNFCQVNGSSDDPQELFKVNDIVDFLSESSYMIQITGGEPLIKKDRVLSLIKKLKKSGNIISILTNLVLIDEYFLEEIGDVFTLMDNIQVSIYAHTSKLHNKISGRDDWEILNNAIKKVLSKNIDLIGNLTLTNENVQYVDEIFNYYRNIGIKQICINGLMRKGLAVDMIDSKYIYNYIYYIHKFVNNNDLEGVSISVPIEVIKTYSNIKGAFGEIVNDVDLVKEEINDAILINSDGKAYYELTGEFLGHIHGLRISNIKNIRVIRDLSSSECAKCNCFNYCQSAGNLKDIFKNLGSIDYSYCDLINL